MRAPLKRWPSVTKDVLLEGRYKAGHPPFGPFPTVTNVVNAAICPVACVHDLLYGIDDAQVDLGIVRGLDYYSGMVFEIDAPRLGAEKQILGGGSYTLSELFGGEPVFSTGFAIGIDRVVLASEAEREIQVEPPLDAYVIPAKDDMRKYAFGIVARLRSQGLRADVDLMRRTLSKNLKYASSVGARYAIIVGKEEMAKRSVTLRDMKSGAQQVVLADEIGSRLVKEKGFSS